MIPYGNCTVSYRGYDFVTLGSDTLIYSGDDLIDSADSEAEAKRVIDGWLTAP